MAISSLQFLMEAGAKEDLFDLLVRDDCVDRGVTPGASISQMNVLYS